MPLLPSSRAAWLTPSAAALVAVVFACSSSKAPDASPSLSSGVPTTLHGTYVALDPSREPHAEFASITFFSGAGYFAYKTSCADAGAPCRSQGTYTFDGKSDLALTDNVTSSVEHVSFQATSLSTPGSVAPSTQPLDLVQPLDGSLVTVPSDGGALVESILQALMNGVAMELFTGDGGDDDGGVPGGYCQVPNGAADCALQGLNAHANGDGSCSCVDAPTGAGFAVPITLMPAASGGTGLFPTVKLSIAGGPPIVAILDTGSTGLVLSPSAVPAGAATRTGGRISAGYGPQMKYVAAVETVPVTLAPGAANGGLVTTAPIKVAQVTQITTCPSGVTCGPDFKFAGSFDAILGVGMRSSVLDSPLRFFGTDATYVVSLDGYGRGTGHLYMNPHAFRTSPFVWTRSQLLPDGSGGWRDDDVAFCANGLCGGGAAGNGVLLDSGNPSTVLKPVTSADFTTIGVAPGVTSSQSPPAGTAFTFRIGTEDPSGNDTSPVWSLTTNDPPTAGVDLITASPTVQGNNLGLGAFYRFDVLYDLTLGQIGLTPKAVTRVCDVKEGLAGNVACPASACVSGGTGSSGSSPLCSCTPLVNGNTPLPDDFHPVLDAMVEGLGCTVLRVYIDPDPGWLDPTAYPPRYGAVLAYARTLGMTIFANPLSTGGFQYKAGGVVDTASYASWIAAYANQWQPDYLGAFNEPGMMAGDLEAIADAVRGALTYPTILVGPDSQHVVPVPGAGDTVSTQQLLSMDPNLPTHFDFFSSHNANGDTNATEANWSAIVTATGRPVWSSENPRPYNFSNAASGGAEIGVAAAVQAGVAGVVLYNVYPAEIDPTGALVNDGANLAAEIP